MTRCKIANCDKPVHAKGLCTSHYRRWLEYGDPLGGRILRGTAVAWMEQHKNFTSDECLIWPFAKARGGYGSVGVGDRTTRKVHRLMCEYRHGPPPHGKTDAAHSCGNGHLGCVNPQHLRWATKAENAADRLIHGTHSRGERSPTAKLTEADVIAIRAAEGVQQRTLAKQFGVCEATISQIINRKHRWTWL